MRIAAVLLPYVLLVEVGSVHAQPCWSAGPVAALSDQPEKAMALIREALDHGLDEPTALGIEQDSDLKSLRGDSRFAVLSAYARQRAATAAKAK